MPLFVGVYLPLLEPLDAWALQPPSHAIDPTWPFPQKQRENQPHILFGSHCIGNHGC